MKIKERPWNLTAEEVQRALAGDELVLLWPIDCYCNSVHGDFLLGDWGLSLSPHRLGHGEGVWRWRGGDKPKPGDWIEEYQTDVDDHASAPVRCPFGEANVSCLVCLGGMGMPMAVICRSDGTSPLWVPRTAPSHLPRYVMMDSGIGVVRLDDIAGEIDVAAFRKKHARRLPPIGNPWIWRAVARRVDS